jgi:SAM-dependent methyltransferase
VKAKQIRLGKRLALVKLSEQAALRRLSASVASRDLARLGPRIAARMSTPTLAPATSLDTGQQSYIGDQARPRLLDLFCGAGGAATGYARAGFEVVGIDIHAQPRYPFEFHQADALRFLGDHGAEFDVVHASPPCQLYSSATRGLRDRQIRFPDLIAPVREALLRTGRPWVIENVVGAPLRDVVLLCGSSFGRPLMRHRLFESSIALLVPPCAHRGMPKVFESPSSEGRRIGRRTWAAPVYGGGHRRGDLDDWRRAMGIDWMSRRELTQAIPPDYTELLGRQIMAAVGQ